MFRLEKTVGWIRYSGELSAVGEMCLGRGVFGVRGGVFGIGWSDLEHVEALRVAGYGFEVSEIVA